MRLFLAIDFPDKAKEALRKTALELKRRSRQGTFTREENFHLTLSFLGETESERLPELLKLMEETGRAFQNYLAAVPGQEIRLIPERIGSFSGRDGDLYYLGFQACPGLSFLYRELTKRLGRAGFPTEERGYRPHVTLGRRVRLQSHRTADGLLSFDGGLILRISEFSLMESGRPDGILRYKTLHRTRLI